jgi:hypothetical protein
MENNGIFWPVANRNILGPGDRLTGIIPGPKSSSEKLPVHDDKKSDGWESLVS